MENAKPGGRPVVLGSVLAALLLPAFFPTPARAGSLPSRSQERSASDAAAADRARIEGVLARQEVAVALAAHGLAPEDVERRLADLSPEDLRTLALNVDQVQAAGNVPNYIWILLGIFLAVSILAAVL